MCEKIIIPILYNIWIDECMRKYLFPAILEICCLFYRIAGCMTGMSTHAEKIVVTHVEDCHVEDCSGGDNAPGRICLHLNLLTATLAVELSS